MAETQYLFLTQPHRDLLKDELTEDAGFGFSAEPAQSGRLACPVLVIVLTLKKSDSLTASAITRCETSQFCKEETRLSR